MSSAAVPPSSEPASAVRSPSVPRSWQQTLVLARYQLRDYLRSRRFVLMMGIVAVTGGILTTLLAYFRPVGPQTSPGSFYAGPWAMGVIYVMVMAGIIYGGDAIAGEFQNRTGYFLLGLPVRRASVYAGKYVAAFAASVVAVLFYLGIMIANALYFLGGSPITEPYVAIQITNGLYTGGGPALSDPVQLAASLGLALLYLLALLGTVFLFSSLFKQSLYGVLVVAVLFLFGWSILQTVVTGLAHIEPWFVISYAAPIIGFPLIGAPDHIIHRFGLTVYNPTIAEGIAVLLGYFLLTTAGGLLLFEREEFT